MLVSSYFVLDRSSPLVSWLLREDLKDKYSQFKQSAKEITCNQARFSKKRNCVHHPILAGGEIVTKARDSLSSVVSSIIAATISTSLLENALTRLASFWRVISSLSGEEKSIEIRSAKYSAGLTCSGTVYLRWQLCQSQLKIKADTST